MDCYQKFAEWLAMNVHPIEWRGTDFKIHYDDTVSLNALAEKVAYMSRADMTTMRTYFRKQVKWKSKSSRGRN